MIETILIAIIVVAAAAVSLRHLLKEVATGKQPCSGCGDDCPLAGACARKADDLGAAEAAAPVRAAGSRGR
jgi:hypothetical protein